MNSSCAKRTWNTTRVSTGKELSENAAVNRGEGEGQDTFEGKQRLGGNVTIYNSTSHSSARL